MDFLSGHERKFSDFEDPDMNDVLGTEMFATSSSMGVDSFMSLPTMTDSDQNDWFSSVFDEQGLVYNDRNLGEAATQQPCIKSEHSYSANNLSPSSPLSLSKMEETDYQSSSIALDLTQKAQLIHAAVTATQPNCFKLEPLDTDPLLMAMTSTDTTTTLTHSANILLTTASSSTSTARLHSGQAVFPTTPTSTTTATVHIKTEPMDTYETFQEQTVDLDSVILPPTPPSSNGSDSDGSQSPQRSAPSSPQRQSPVAQSGVLILTEEEKRTLMSEGYPIPSKLPLTKQEEKNLKKVRRKIKNKISAQESRRKKKEYVEALEKRGSGPWTMDFSELLPSNPHDQIDDKRRKRVEAFNHENSDLKKKLESLESNNRSLLGQLHKLQALVAKVPKSAAASATQTGTVLM